MPLAFFARCTFIPFQIPQTLRANVFPVCFVVLNFAAVRRYICCALALRNVAIVAPLGLGSPRRTASPACGLGVLARRDAVAGGWGGGWGEGTSWR